MNTATFPETQALHAVAAAAAITAAAGAEPADAPPAVVVPYVLLLIPLSKLSPSSRNVRKSGGTSIPELAASIARVGLLQNLTVIACADGEHFEVVAGKRRLAALKLLAKRRRLVHSINAGALPTAPTFDHKLHSPLPPMFKTTKVKNSQGLSRRQVF